MAGQESLGRAILYLSVDDTALRDGVRRARQFVDRELGRRTGQGGRSGANADRAADRRASTMVITRNLGERLNRLEERGVNVAKIRSALGRAALATDQGRLETARSLNKLAREFIISNERGLRGTSRIGRQLADPIDALFQAQKRRYSLDQQIRSLEAGGLITDRFRARLGEVTTAQAQRRFGLAKQLSDQLNFDLRKERDKLSIQQKQNALANRELRLSQKSGGARSPIGGATFIPGSPAAIAAAARAGGARSSIRGSVDIPGSPAWIAAYQAEIDKAARAGGARSSIKGNINIPGSPAFIEAQKQEIAKAARAGGPTSPLRGAVNIPGSPAFIEAQTAAYNRAINKAARAGGPTSPIRGNKNLVGSPAYFEEIQRQVQRQSQGRQGRLSSALIGGAFPLLFGQGPGAAVGGAIGGLAGGGPLGFGLSLVGTALGAAFDTAIQKAQLLAGAIDSPVQKFQELAAAGLISSKALENEIAALIATGRTAEAAALLQQDLASQQFDPANAKRLEEETRNLNNYWNDLSLTLASVAAGPLADIIAAFNKLLGGSVGRSDFSNLDKEIAAVVTAARKQRVAQQNTQTGGQLDIQVVQAQLANDKLRTLELQKQKLVIDKSNEAAAFGTKTEADKIQQDAISQKYKLKELEIEGQITQEIQRRAQLALQLQYAQKSFGQSDVVRAFQQVQLQVLSTLQQFGPASTEFKLALQEGANTVLENTKNAAQNLRDAFRSLIDLQQSNLRFLSPQERQTVVERARQQALPEAQRRGVVLRGVEDLFAFNKFIEQEATTRQNLIDAQQNMVDANNSLNSSIVSQTGSLNTLTGVMERLVDKSWSVYVEVPGQNGVAGLNLQTQLS